MPTTKAEDDDYWDNQVTEMIRGELAAALSAATAWKNLFAALLGIFTAAAFAGGITTVSKLPDPWAGRVR